MGFERAGFEIVWTNENNELFAKMHAAGITSWRQSRGNGVKAEIFNTKSIEKIKTTDILSEAFQNKKPAHFGIIGGPPCQDFSMYGSRGGFEGNRGKLTILFFKKIMELKPTFFVMENVTGLIRQKSNREYLAKLLKKLQNFYFIDYKTLNALNFGVPQNRERVFFVGIRKSKVNKRKLVVELNGQWFSWPVNSVYQDSLTKYSWPDASDYGKRLTKPSEIPIELCVENCLIQKEEIGQVSNASEYFNLYVSEDKLNKIQEGQTNRPSFKRLHRFRYSPTACYGNNEVHLHPYKHRRISVREALRIQGVPDEYVLPPELPLSKKFKMIGNGVPVPLAEAVGAAMKKFLESNGLLKTKKINGHMVKGKEKPGNVQNQRKKHKA